MRKTRNPFTTITTAGLLLPVDLLTRVVEGDPDLPGLTPKDYHLHGGERLNEAASRAWNQCQAAWKTFRKQFAVLPASDTGTTVTRDQWLLPLFQELGYGRLQTKPAIKFEEKEYPVSHGWENHVPIHLLSARYPLDRRTPGVAGAAARSPYSMLQELLNRSAQHRWGFVSNGLKLFVLRDNAALARAANVEFDLEAMMDGEIYADFMLLFLLGHQSRVEILPRAALASGRGSRGKRGKSTAADEPDDEQAEQPEAEEHSGPENCWLEKWSHQADQQGTRAREKLRDGVEAAIRSLGAGFLTTKGNNALRDRLRSGELPIQDYYRQLLRLVYRLLMLLVAEEKKTESGDNLLHPPGTTAAMRDRYARFYSVGRIRTLAEQRRGTSHTDLYESLKVLFLKMRDGYAPLGIPGFGSFLFSPAATPDLDRAGLANQDLLDAFRHLCYTEDTSGRGGVVRRPVDFGNLGSEELGSVYESLLELHPQIDTDAGPFTLGTAAGHERKTTGSYYTPTSLINCLLDSALDPVVAEAIEKPDAKQAEAALLDLKICDPACGSGHFLIAAAERMATHLARLRTGDDEPGTLDIKHAKRDIIGRCIYGVDLNPMAVELCKVSLWMEALEPGRPLSFLDHHIQCGNSLLGATPKLLADGIPDDAFNPIEGDDKAICTQLKKDNKRERSEYKSGQGYLFEPAFKLGAAATEFARLTAASDDSVESLSAKEQWYAQLVKGADYRNARFWADTWCTAFVWKKDKSDLGTSCPTERKFRDIERNPHNVLPDVRVEVERLRSQYQFFHWHLAFPDVFRLPAGELPPENKQCGWDGGFDVVLGNPPWEQAELEENEWFAARSPKIAAAQNQAERKRKIRQLLTDDVNLYAEYLEAKRWYAGVAHVIVSSGRFPKCAKGRTNTFSIFAELNVTIVCDSGRVGCIVPTGIATDNSSKTFFAWLLDNHLLRSLFDFHNHKKHFPTVRPHQHFSLLTIGNGPDNSVVAYYAFSLAHPMELAEPDKVLTLTSDDICLANPNTRTCPLFQTSRDALLVRKVHSHLPILVQEHAPKSNPWNVTFKQGLFNVTSDSELFATRSDLTDAGFKQAGCHFERDREVYVPLFDPKLAHPYNHRAAKLCFSGHQHRKISKEPSDVAELANPHFAPDLLYFVPRLEVDKRLAEWTKDWLLGFKDVTGVTSMRLGVFAIIPRMGVGNPFPLIFSDIGPRAHALLLANLNSLAVEQSLRLKINGLHLNFFYLKQVPVVPPSAYEAECIWDVGQRLETWILRRALELTFTAWSLEAFARDCGYEGPPFRWNEERRFFLRCELDAAYFHLYSIERDEVEYIMDTFAIIRRKDEQGYGEYRTKRLVLEIYKQIADAICTGRPYQPQLDLPPGPPTDTAGDFIRVSDWDPSKWPAHIHTPRELKP